MIVCVAGSPSIDRLFEVRTLTVGEIHRPSQQVRVPGGKGLNVARAVAALGEDVIVAGVLAGHAGRWVQESLAGEGIDGRFAWTEGETRSSLSVADLESGRLTEFYEADVTMTSDAWHELEQLTSAALPGASWLSLSGSVPQGASDAGYAAMIEDAQRRGVPAAVDTRGVALAMAVGARPALVKINVHEAGELLGDSIRGTAAAHAAASEIRRLQGGEGRATIVTMGVEGTVVVDSDGAGWFGRVDALGRYPVGSGDAFLAGVLVGRCRGEPWHEAMRLALGAAVANAEQPGAGRLDPARAAALAAGAIVRPL